MHARGAARYSRNRTSQRLSADLVGTTGAAAGDTGAIAMQDRYAGNNYSASNTTSAFPTTTEEPSHEDASAPLNASDYGQPSSTSVQTSDSFAATPVPVEATVIDVSNVPRSPTPILVHGSSSSAAQPNPHHSHVSLEEAPPMPLGSSNTPPSSTAAPVPPPVLRSASTKTTGANSTITSLGKTVRLPPTSGTPTSPPKKPAIANMNKWTSLRSKVGAVSSFTSSKLPMPSQTALDELDANLDSWQHDLDGEGIAIAGSGLLDGATATATGISAAPTGGSEVDGKSVSRISTELLKPEYEHGMLLAALHQTSAGSTTKDVFGGDSASMNASATAPLPPPANESDTSLGPESKLVNTLAGGATPVPGAPPGIDPHHLPANLRAQLAPYSSVRIVDYNPQRIRSLPEMTDAADLEAALQVPKPKWAQTRWICVDGISADTVSVLATRYSLHPLAVEDLFHFPQRVKVDFYENFTFVSVHLIGFASQLFPKKKKTPPTDPNNPNSTTQSSSTDEDHVPFKFWDPRTWVQPPTADLSDTASTQVYLILTPPPENTVILFCQHTSRPLAAPIVARLRNPSTILRSSSDPSFLLYAILDCIVDHSVLLVRSYQGRMAELEAAVFKHALSLYTKDLQFLRGEIQGIRIAVSPLRGVVAQLRSVRPPGSGLSRGKTVKSTKGVLTKKDSLADAASLAGSAGRGRQTKSTLERNKSGGVVSMAEGTGESDAEGDGEGADDDEDWDEDDEVPVATNAPATGLGFAFALTAGTFGDDSIGEAAGAAMMLGPDLITPLTKLFFGDVLDHISTVLDVVDLLERSAGDLIDLIFNTIATNTNDNMRVLAVVSIIFLPCTFLTGFFGMNIVDFPELEITGGSRTVWIMFLAITVGTLIVFGIFGMLDCECCYYRSAAFRRRKRLGRP